MKFLYLFLAIVATGLTFQQCSSSNKDKEQIHKQIKSELDVLNKQAPVQMTEKIRFDSCTVHSNNDVEYFYSITDTLKPDDAFFKQIESEAKEMTKNDLGMADIRSYEVSILYNYNDLNGSRLYSFKIVPSDYK